MQREEDFMADQNSDRESIPDIVDLNRRKFFVKLGAGSLAVAGIGAATFAAQYLAPNVLYEASPVVNVGRPEHYPTDSVTLDPRFGIFVVNAAEGFYALSAVCSHLGCLSVWKSETSTIVCPCHGSGFRRDGSIIAGPAPKPLPWLHMWLTDDGDLIVDRGSKVPAGKEYVRI
jgi:cytochrome b6-f complex iron-sulfur subunit